MKFAYYTERPSRWVAEEEVFKNKAWFGVSNALYDSIKAADEYNYYLDENCYAEELGFDLVALNEHHGNPYCMGSVMNIEAGILARITRRVKILLIGNPLPVVMHPLRMAEELAEIDVISRGRLISGFVRGAGSEQFINNANPAYNREYFNEAHDFILQAWTRPGPWRYEGRHFHYRYVNPWAVPYQKPHPPIWIPGVLSPETVQWCAAKRYPYVGLGTALGPTADLWDYYADEAASQGYQAGPENFGYLVPTFLAETEEKGQEVGKGFIYGGGQANFSRPEHTLPPGYVSKQAIRNLAKQPGGSWLGVSPEKLYQSQGKAPEDLDFAEVRKKLLSQYDKSQRALQTLVGTPKSVIPKIKIILEILRPGTLTFFAVQGPVSNADRLTSMELLAQEVIPEIRDYARQNGLLDAFERTPGSVSLRPDVARDPVVDRASLAKFRLR